MPDYSENIQTYLKMHCRELFRMAHAICGNAELAELALIKAVNHLLSAPEGEASMRETFFRAMADSAFAQHARLNSDTYPLNFSCFEFEEESDAVGAWLAAQKSDVRRILFLRYGCRLGVGSISRAAAISRQEAKGILIQAHANFSRALSDIPFDAAMAQYSRRELARTDIFAPDPGSILRTCEANSRPEQKRTFSLSRMFKALFTLIFALILAAFFWVFAAVTGTTPDPAIPTSSPAPIETILQ